MYPDFFLVPLLAAESPGTGDDMSKESTLISSKEASGAGLPSALPPESIASEAAGTSSSLTPL